LKTGEKIVQSGAIRDWGVRVVNMTDTAVITNAFFPFSSSSSSAFSIVYARAKMINVNEFSQEKPHQK